MRPVRDLGGDLFLDPWAARMVRRGVAYSRPAAELQEVMSELLAPDPSDRPEAPRGASALLRSLD